MNTTSNQARAIFLQVIEQAVPENRAEFLAQACEGNAELHAQVQRLLRSHELLGSFHDAPGSRGADSNLSVTETPGDTIGPYKLQQQIGEGGMGVVFIAEQDRPVRRRVALKVIKPGMDTREVIGRFEAERQALALMDHRHIAKVLDAGATDTGRPYFVMELVHGVPITEYCDHCNLAMRERLELFIAVCQAVQHAHQKGIIHRDLKPTNVLVAIEDGKPLPKIIDFGVAKAVNQRLSEHSLQTAFTQLIGTPLYMSPEQSELSALGVDTRSDIYSLGVLLYELLTGTTPFEKERLHEVAYDEMRRIIREEEPPRPSDRLSTLGPRAETVAENRRTDTKKLCQLVSGELDWIVMKALEKDRNRRYETATGLLQDIERYLADKPVEACPPSAMYRFRKFARRNRTGLAMAGAIGLALLLLLGGVGWMLRERATRQVVLNQQITQSLEESKSWYEAGKLIEAMSSVKRAEGLLASGSQSDEPRIRVDQWRTDLETVQRLDQIRLDRVSPYGARWEGPANRFENSLALQENRIDDQQGLDPAGASKAYDEVFQRFGLDVNRLGVQVIAARISESPIKRELIAALDDWFHLSVAGSSPGVTVPYESKKLLQIAMKADPDPWRDRLREAIQQGDTTAIGKLAEDSNCASQPVTTVLLLVRALQAQDPTGSKMTEVGARILRQVLRRHPDDFWINVELANCLPKTAIRESIIYRRIALALRPESPEVYRALCACLMDQGNRSEAEELARETIRRMPNSATAHRSLASVLEHQDKNTEAEAAYREAIRLDPDNANYHRSLGWLLFNQQKYADAETTWREAVRLNPNSAPLRDALARSLIRQGKVLESEADCREAIRLDPTYSLPYRGLGFALRRQGRIEEAEAAHREAIRLDPNHPANHQSLGVFLASQGRFAEAEAPFREGIRLYPKRAYYRAGLADVLTQQCKDAEAEGIVRDAIRLEPHICHHHTQLGFSLSRQGKFAEAEAAYSEALRLTQDFQPALSELARHLANVPEQQLRDVPRALELAKKAVEVAPENGAGWTTLGVVHYRAGSWRASQEALEKSLELRDDPRYGDAYQLLFLAMANWQQGHKDDARKWYDRAVDWTQQQSK